MFLVRHSSNNIQQFMYYELLKVLILCPWLFTRSRSFRYTISGFQYDGWMDGSRLQQSWCYTELHICVPSYCMCSSSAQASSNYFVWVLRAFGGIIPTRTKVVNMTPREINLSWSKSNTNEMQQVRKSICSYLANEYVDSKNPHEFEKKWGWSEQLPLVTFSHILKSCFHITSIYYRYLS